MLSKLQILEEKVTEVMSEKLSGFR